ncbi:MAG: sigma-70 family RNA polymerase sigma factor [Rubrivivax sp.]|nr:sigma-70 family RNA polymerase sigma factor [Pyrinomonadaceae bacterium]
MTTIASEACGVVCREFARIVNQVSSTKSQSGSGIESGSLMLVAQSSIINFESRRALPAKTSVAAVRVEDFEAAALPHLNELFRTAARLVGNRTEAEDLIQETYLQAWKSFHRFELGTNCRAWLFRILLNKAHHQRRWLFWRKSHDSEAELENSLEYRSPINEQLADEEMLLALARLPRPYRAAVLLADVEDFSYKEIAALQRVPIGTVMSRLSRGRKLLRAELADVAESYGIKNEKK